MLGPLGIDPVRETPEFDVPPGDLTVSDIFPAPARPVETRRVAEGGHVLMTGDGPGGSVRTAAVAITGPSLRATGSPQPYEETK
ncbi:hypothetical protein ACFCX4_00015 [Kitasatospora sp. NPDC056327]|uniref:hypothetical protein n=1 Tax=Kitasatospora sp. NPDC056327 TaxID=3345785 RepID=UPI0035D5BE0A